MRTVAPRLLTPSEDAEVYPYRRVWGSLAIESGILFAVGALAWIAVTLLNVQSPAGLARPLGLAAAAIPLGLWLIFSLLRERAALLPRARLMAVAAISALAANAVGVPLVEEVFQPGRWLSLSSAINRIIGYTFTVGITQEVIKYIVVWAMAWEDQFRTRVDGIAYALASAVGYATVLNVRYVLTFSPSPDVALLTIFDTTALLFAGSILVGYGLAETRLTQPSPFLMLITVALAALITGAAIPMRAGIVNAGFSLNGGAASPIFGVALSAIFLIGSATFVAFLIRNAERREREAVLVE